MSGLGRDSKPADTPPPVVLRCPEPEQEEQRETDLPSSFRPKPLHWRHRFSISRSIAAILARKSALFAGS